MARCTYCMFDMSAKTTVTCVQNTTVGFPHGRELKSIPFDSHDGRRCHDCNVADGGNHHPGCDMERCPKCGGQLISCGCLDKEDA